MADAAEHRFRAIKVEDTVQFHGSLGDTTRFEPIRELLTGAKFLDLKQLKSASFNGLKSLLTLLAKENATITLRNIPVSTYRNLGLLFEEGYTLPLESFEVLTVRNDAIDTLEASSFTSEMLMNLLFSEGDFGSHENRRVLLSLRHLCRPLLPPGTPLEPRFLNPWSMANASQVSFWLDYASFALSIMDTSCDGLTSLSISLVEKVGSLSLRISNANKGLALLQGTDREAPPQASEAITQCTASIIGQIDRARAAYRTLILNLNLALSGSPAEHTTFFEFLETLRTLGKGELAQLVNSIETMGAELASHLLSLYSAQPYVEAFQKAPQGEIGEELLEDLRDAFLIMDIMSEGDVAATMEEIITELTAIEADLMSNMVDLQTFDLTRQIIEHRIKESECLEVLLPACAAQEMPWELVRDELLEMAGSKLVTDQEKDAFAFHFPYFQRKSSGSMPAGEVSFF